MSGLRSFVFANSGGVTLPSIVPLDELECTTSGPGTSPCSACLPDVPGCRQLSALQDQCHKVKINTTQHRAAWYVTTNHLVKRTPSITLPRRSAPPLAPDKTSMVTVGMPDASFGTANMSRHNTSPSDAMPSVQRTRKEESHDEHNMVSADKDMAYKNDWR